MAEPSTPDKRGAWGPLKCSFCGVDLKTTQRRTFAGPSVYICEECVLLALEVFREDDVARGVKPGERG